MTRVKQGKNLLNSFKARLVLSLVVLHLLIAIALYAVLMNRVEYGFEKQFQEQVQATSKMAAKLVEEHGLDQQTRLQSRLENIMASNDILSLRLIRNGADVLRIVPPLKDQRQRIPFVYKKDLGVSPVSALELLVVFNKYQLIQQISDFSVYVKILMFLYVFLAISSLFAVSFIVMRSVSTFQSKAKAVGANPDTTFNGDSELSEFKELGDSLEQIRGELLLREQIIAEKEQFNRSIMESVSDAILIFDEYGAILDSNKPAQQMFDYTSAQLLTVNILELLKSPHEFLGIYTARMKVFDVTGGTHELLGCSSNSAEFQVETTISSFEVGLDICFVASIRLLKHTQKSQYQGVQSAYYDSLTGLPNKELCKDRLKHAMLRAKRNQSAMVLLYIDLDGFDKVNQVLGRRGGDELLVLTANRITQCVRKSDTVARFGGDEFIVILEAIENGTAAEVPAQKIIFALQQAFQINKRDVYSGCSIGISTYPGSVEEIDDLVMEADMAMYKAKHSGGNNFEVFTDEMRQDLLELDHRIRCLK